MYRILIILTLAILLSSLSACRHTRKLASYQSSHLKVQPLSEHSFLHVSYLSTQTFGKVACNGLVVINQGEAYILDSPVNDTAAAELIDFVTHTLRARIKGVIATHFHVDCIGGLNAFHQASIESMASKQTIALLGSSLPHLPNSALDLPISLPLGKDSLRVSFFGPGHTADNIVAYFAPDEILFGGCLIKSVGASRGFVGDANLNQWPKTVSKVKSQYPQLVKVVPGHGSPGGSELLDYTIELFLVKE